MRVFDFDKTLIFEDSTRCFILDNGGYLDIFIFYMFSVFYKLCIISESNFRKVINPILDDIFSYPETKFKYKFSPTVLFSTLMDGDIILTCAREEIINHYLLSLNFKKKVKVIGTTKEKPILKGDKTKIINSFNGVTVFYTDKLSDISFKDFNAAYSLHVIVR